jgi:hypothetical protein
MGKDLKPLKLHFKIPSTLRSGGGGDFRLSGAVHVQRMETDADQVYGGSPTRAEQKTTAEQKQQDSQG